MIKLIETYATARQLNIRLIDSNKVIDSVSCNPLCYYEYKVSKEELLKRNNYPVYEEEIIKSWLYLLRD